MCGSARNLSNVQQRWGGGFRHLLRNCDPNRSTSLSGCTEMKSIKGLARHLGVHHHTVRKHLIDRGIEIEQPRQMSDDELALASHLYIDEQLTAAQIAPKIGFTASTIVKALNRAGVKMRAQVARG